MKNARPALSHSIAAFVLGALMGLFAALPARACATGRPDHLTSPSVPIDHFGAPLSLNSFPGGRQ